MAASELEHANKYTVLSILMGVLMTTHAWEKSLTLKYKTQICSQVQFYFKMRFIDFSPKI